jgi:hypothetical protein
MIHDSQVWKEVLLAELRGLREYLAKAQASRRSDVKERALVRVEKFVFISAFVMRKLFEVKKISDEIARSELSVRSFARNSLSGRIHRMNWDRINLHYHLDRPMSKKVLVRTLCNQLIHSAVFLCHSNDEDGAIEGFYVTSDEQKETGLLYVGLKIYCDVVERVISDEIVSWVANFQTGASIQSNRIGTEAQQLKMLDAFSKPKSRARRRG